MRNEKSFPSIRLAETSEIQPPNKLYRLKLKELAERLDQLHNFTKGQLLSGSQA